MNASDFLSLKEVIAVGKEHGAQPDDIYGCFYFFVSSQLRKFSDRLKQWPIHFKFFETGASELAQRISSGSLVGKGLPPTVKFDRIKVSNLVDDNYIGIKDVLAKWGPLLATGEYSAIIGYFTNWVLSQPRGRLLRGGSDAEIEKATKRLVERAKVS